MWSEMDDFNIFHKQECKLCHGFAHLLWSMINQYLVEQQYCAVSLAETKWDMFTLLLDHFNVISYNA